MEQEEPQRFEQWALVELFGHQRIAGLISEQTLGSGSFVRVDVPAIGDTPAFTKVYGNAAIYAMTFVTEAVARAAAGAYRVRPISEYDLPELRRLPGPRDDDPDA
jgi:hypothetical protein